MECFLINKEQENSLYHNSSSIVIFSACNVRVWSRDEVNGLRHVDSNTSDISGTSDKWKISEDPIIDTFSSFDELNWLSIRVEQLSKYSNYKNNK